MSRRALVLFALVLTAAPAVRAQTISVQTAGDLSSLVGMPFDVPIVADWNGRPDRLGSFALTLRWNPTVLRFESAGPGSFGSIQANTDSVGQGVLKLAGANPAGVTGIITLGIGRFTPLAASTTALLLTVDDIYSIAPDFTDLVAFTTMQGGLFCPARGHWGDPDGDGTVGSRDALIALTEAVGLDVSAIPEHGLADVDADAAVKARDALIILSSAVGLDVSAYRVLRIAVGSCGSEQTTTYTVMPGGETIVARGQQALHFELRATASGVVRTLPDVFWSSSDPAVLAVLPDGRGVPVGPGTAVVTGKSGQRDSATASLVVVTRRSHHVVDALAISAATRLGTPTYPYATLVEASGVASEGDTVTVRPGRYDDPATFGVGVLVQGLSGGSTGGVVLTGASQTTYAALTFAGGTRAEVRNVTADRVAIGIAASGVDTLVVDSLRYFEGSGLCGDYGVATGEIWRLEVRRSELRGAGKNAGCAGGIGVTSAAGLVLVEDVEVSDFADDAIYAPLVDSTVVRRSRIHDNSGYAVDVDAYSYGSSAGKVPVPTSTALLVEDGRFLNNDYGGVSAGAVRGGRVTRTTIETVEGDGIYLNGTSGAADRFAIVADTIRGFENYWLTAYDVDSLSVDSTVVLETQAGYVNGFTHIALTRSLLDRGRSGTMLYLYGNYLAAARVDIDSVSLRGDPACSRCANGVQTYQAVVAVNRFTGDNLGTALSLSDSAATVTNSTISNADYGIHAFGPTYGVSVAPRVLVRRVVMDDVVSGIQADYVALVADSVDLTRGYYGIQTTAGYGPSGPDTVRNGAFADYAYAVLLIDSMQVVTGNTILRPGYYGILTSGYGTTLDSTIVLNNVVTCDAAGASSASALYTYASNGVVEGNTVSGCGSGFSFSGGAAGVTVGVRGNALAMPAQAQGAAIAVLPPYRADIVSNTIVGSGYSGAIYSQGAYYGRVPTARVDSNTITGAHDRAIWFDYTDSVQARFNFIDSVVVSGWYGARAAVGIGLQYASDLRVNIGHNTIRRVAGRGVHVSQGGSAVVVVDSNGVSGSDSAAVWIDGGQVSMRGNNIRNNAVYGVAIPSCCGPHEIHGNAFQGNGLYAASSTGDATVNADSNWWGADAQPPGGPGADSTLNVFDAAPLATEPAPLPSLAPSLRLTSSLPRMTASSPLPGLAARVQTAAAPSVPVAAVVERPLPSVSGQVAARRAARPALAEPFEGFRREARRTHELRLAAARTREDARVASMRAQLEAEAARKAARRQP